MSLFSRAKADRKATTLQGANMYDMTMYEDLDRVILNNYAFLNLEIPNILPKNGEPASLTLAVPPTVSLESQGLTPQYEIPKEDLPPGWTACKDAKGRLYYFNYETGQSHWSRTWEGTKSSKGQTISEFDVNSHIKVNGNTTIRASMASPDSIARGSMFAGPGLVSSPSSASLAANPSMSSQSLGSPEIGGLPSQPSFSYGGGAHTTNRTTVVSGAVRATRPRMHTLLEKPDNSRRIRAFTNIPEGAQPPPPTSVRGSLAMRPTLVSKPSLPPSSSNVASSPPKVIHEDGEAENDSNPDDDDDDDDDDGIAPPPPPLSLPPKRATMFHSTSSGPPGAMSPRSPSTIPSSAPSPMQSSVSSPAFPKSGEIKITVVSSPPIASPPLVPARPPASMPSAPSLIPPPVAPRPASSEDPSPPPPPLPSKRLSMLPPPPPPI